jgi:hypothetical protein
MLVGFGLALLLTDECRKLIVRRRRRSRPPVGLVRHCAELEPVMNLIEKVMVHTSSHVKLALAAAALVLVLWATGSPLPSLWITPAVIALLWTAIRFGLGYRHRHHGA